MKSPKTITELLKRRDIAYDICHKDGHSIHRSDYHKKWRIIFNNGTSKMYRTEREAIAALLKE